jgi:hypothetical protein
MFSALSPIINMVSTVDAVKAINATPMISLRGAKVQLSQNDKEELSVIFNKNIPRMGIRRRALSPSLG